MTADKNLTASLGWSYVLDGSRLVAQFVIIYVVADIIGPDAWGVVSIATQFVFFAEVLQQQGLLSAIIQRRRLTNTDLSSAFWLLVGTSSFMALVTVAISGWLGEVYDSHQLTNLLRALALGLLIKGASLVPEAAMRREMMFRKLALRTNVAVVGGVVVGLGSAVAGAGGWAIVLQVLTQATIEFLLVWKLTEWRPSLLFRWERLKGLLTFSVGSFLAAVALFLYMRVEVFLMAPIFAGSPADDSELVTSLGVVGLYMLGFRLVEQGSQLAVRAVQGVALPELSRLQHEPAAFNHRFAELIRVGTAVSALVLGPAAAAAPDLVAVLGDEWAPAVPVVRILCVAAVLKSLNLLTSPGLQAAGRPFVNARVAWIGAIAMTVGAVVVAFSVSDADVSTQLQAMAWTRVGFELGVLAPVSYLALRSSTGLRVGPVLSALRPGAIAAAAAVVAVALVRWTGVFTDYPAIVRLVVHGGLAVTVALAALAAGEPLVRDRLRGRFASAGERESTRVPTGS